jgi:hypothetical protein
MNHVVGDLGDFQMRSLDRVEARTHPFVVQHLDPESGLCRYSEHLRRALVMFKETTGLPVEDEDLSVIEIAIQTWRKQFRSSESEER